MLSLINSILRNICKFLLNKLQLNADDKFIMYRFRLLSSTFVGILFYVLFSMFLGRDGIWATNQLQKQKKLLIENTTKIENVTENLMLEKIALENDKDLIASYARKLGYVSSGEKLIKISGLNIREATIYESGTVLKCQSIKYIPEWICKVVGLVTFIVVYISFILYDIKVGYIDLPRKKQYERMVKGTRVYDMQ